MRQLTNIMTAIGFIILAASVSFFSYPIDYNAKIESAHFLGEEIQLFPRSKIVTNLDTYVVTQKYENLINIPSGMHSFMVFDATNGDPIFIKYSDVISFESIE